jgi:hypothetical protein
MAKYTSYLKNVGSLKALGYLVTALLLAACAPANTAGAWAMPAQGQPNQAQSSPPWANQPGPNQAGPNQAQENQPEFSQPQQPPEVAQVQEPPREIDPWLSSLWFDMSMGSQLVGLYNDYAGTRDMARADHVSLVDLLDKVKVGHRLVVFKNAADIEQLVPHLVGKLDIIGYNLEGGPANRPDEQADPLGSIRRVRAIADQYGMQVAFGPDHDIAVNYGAQMAPYADYFVLQVQRVQTEPQTVRDFVVPLAAQLRQANPNIQVSVQIRTEGDVGQLADLLLSMKGSIDGVSILTNDETEPVAKSLVAELRLPVAEAAPAQPGPSPTPAKSEPSVAVVATPTTSTKRAAVATPPPPVPIPGPPAVDNNNVRSFLLLIGLSIMGIIIGGVVVTVLIYSFRTARGR